MASRLMVSLRVRASADRAFAVFTDDIGLWWQPNSLFSFTPRSPGTMAFEGGERLVERLDGGRVFEVGRVSVWDPGRRLVFGWRQASFGESQATEVEVTFEAVGEETRVTVVHSGWDSVPQSHVAKHGFANMLFIRRHSEWWTNLLARLGDRI